jgi:hypothetical protein
MQKKSAYNTITFFATVIIVVVVVLIPGLHGGG